MKNNNLNVIMNSKLLDKEIHCLGAFIRKYVNGQFDGEFNLYPSYGLKHKINSILIPRDGEYNQVIKLKNSIIIIMNNGDIVEFVKVNSTNYLNDNVLKVVEKIYNNKELMIEEQHYSITGKKERAIRKISFHEAVEKIKKSFYIGNKKIENSYEILDTDQKALIFVEFTGDTTGQGDLYCYNKIFISNPIKISNSPNKIIQSNKFRSHMQVHEKDFIIPYQHIIQYALCKGYFNDINERFIDMVVEFPFNIGYSLLCETTAQDTIVYAKRKNREIHSRFTLDGEKKLTNKCVFILNRSNQEPNEYYLITMFSGEYLVKEPQDKNIKDELERQRMLEFWRNHALVFNPKDVDLETATYSCPYDLGA